MKKDNQIRFPRPKDYIVIAFTIQNLVNDGYKFIEHLNGVKIIDDEGMNSWLSQEEFKKWIFEMALEY